MYENYETMQIQTWISKFNSEEINTESIQKYLDFIQHAIKCHDSNKYSEWHHVIPKCVDESHEYDKEVVRINGADHFRAHMLLIECFNGKKKCSLSFTFCIMRKECKKDITPDEWEEAHRIHSKCISGENSYFYGKVGPLNHNYGKTRSIETRNKIQDAQLKNHADFTGENNPMYNKLRITDGVHNTVINKEDALPEGWHYGITMNREKDISGDKNPFYGKSWITNGKVNSFIGKDDPVPEGWRKGTTLPKRYYHLTCRCCGNPFLGTGSKQKYCEKCR